MSKGGLAAVGNGSAPEVTLERVPCNLCDADDAQVLFYGRDRLHDLPGEFRVVRCRQCGLIYLNPRPISGEIGRYYPADYHPYVAPVRAGQHRVSRWDQRYGLYKRLRAVAALQTGRRLLDVGCGSGDFIAFAREQGWQVQGVELSESAAASCRDRLGLPVVTGDLHAAALPAGQLDVVTLWNVFEHLFDPAATLVEIRRILVPGGLLVMAVPDAGSLDARIFGPRWAGYDVPRHLYTFDRLTLSRMLSQAGFKVVRRRCLDSSHSVFFFSLRFWLHGRAGWQWARPWAERLERSRLIRLIDAPYFWVVDALLKGPVVTLFARADTSSTGQGGGQ
jgi:SAM-dependent methyltransferase